MTEADGMNQAAAEGSVRRARAGGGGIGARLGALALELAVLGVAWWLLKFPLPFLIGVGAVIAIHNIVPERYSSAAMGASLLGFAGVLWLGYGLERIPAVIGLLRGDA
jgi:hypothetical protein